MNTLQASVYLLLTSIIVGFGLGILWIGVNLAARIVGVKPREYIEWLKLLAYAIFVVRDRRLVRLVWHWPWLSVNGSAMVADILKEHEEGKDEKH